MRIRFNVCSNKSKGLKLLKEELRLRGHDATELKVRGSNYRYQREDLGINWGCGPNTPLFPSSSLPLNSNARNASNKLLCFQLMVRNGLRWTTDIEEAKTYPLCYCRTKLYSSQGRGIVIATRPEEVVPAPLYTKGIEQVEGEYRLHVFKGQVIDFSKKMKMNSARLVEENITHNPLIRNHSNGYIFGREGVYLDPEMERVAREALEDLQLDFGAVDIVKSAYSGKSFILEVNTAPGLMNTTVVKYADAIENYIQQIG